MRRSSYQTVLIFSLSNIHFQVLVLWYKWDKKETVLEQLVGKNFSLALIKSGCLHVLMHLPTEENR